jgi:hypothetical protein
MPKKLAARGATAQAQQEKTATEEVTAVQSVVLMKNLVRRGALGWRLRERWLTQSASCGQPS